MKNELPDLRAVLKQDGGFTFNIVQNNFIREGFAVSIHKDHEVRIPGMASTRAMLEYASTKRRLLESIGFLGAWYNTDDEHTYLDVTMIVPDEQSAIELAKANKQLAYFDFATKEVKYV